MRLSEAQKRGLTPLARIVGHASFAQAPGLFTTAPVGSIQRLLARTGWSLEQVDLFEINEAFAVVPMVAMRDLGIPTSGSTCTAAPAPSATPSVRPVRGCW